MAYSLKSLWTNTRKQIMGNPNKPQPEIDADQHWGRYTDQEKTVLDRTNKQKEWRNDLDKRLRYKSLNIPLPQDEEYDPMQVDNTRVTTVNGMNWQTLAVIIGGLLGTGYLYIHAPQNQPLTHPAPVIVPQAVSPAPAAPTPQDLHFGADIEIRDAVTGQPIHVDWKKSFSPLPAPPANQQPQSPLPPALDPLGAVK